MVGGACGGGPQDILVEHDNRLTNLRFSPLLCIEVLFVIGGRERTFNLLTNDCCCYLRYQRLTKLADLGCQRVYYFIQGSIRKQLQLPLVISTSHATGGPGVLEGSLFENILLPHLSKKCLSRAQKISGFIDPKFRSRWILRNIISIQTYRAPPTRDPDQARQSSDTDTGRASGGHWTGSRVGGTIEMIPSDQLLIRNIDSGSKF